MLRTWNGIMEHREDVEKQRVYLDPENEDDQPGRDVIIVFAVFFEGGWPPYHYSWAGGWGTIRFKSSPGASRTVSGGLWRRCP